MRGKIDELINLSGHKEEFDVLANYTFAKMCLE